MTRGIVGIYIIRNAEDGKVYIGQSVDVEYRICNHFSKLKWNRHDNEHMQRAYNKKPAAFSWELLCECSQEELDEKEIEYIKRYNSTDCEIGYNMQYGGQIEHRATMETRQKMSEAKKGKKFTKEHAAKIGEANRRRVLSAETKAKIGLKQRRAIIQLGLDGTFIRRFNSIKEAKEAVGLKSHNSINNALKGITAQSAGYKWIYG